MKTRRCPIGTGLIERFGSGRHTESVIGDIIEQYSEGRSRLWYWRQVLVAVNAGLWFSLLETRQFTMRHLVIWVFSLAATFALGFWTASSRWIIREEMPASDEIELMRRVERDVERTAEIRRYATREFLHQELEKAKANNLAARTTQTQGRVRELEQKLEAAERHSQPKER